MKVTIDSTEPLADALRVIGALYNVTLSASDNAAAEKELQTAPRARRLAATTRKSSPPATATKSTRRSETITSKSGGRAAPPVSTAQIRSWAKTNGHEVSSRGSLPASIKTAYADAHSG